MSNLDRKKKTFRTKDRHKNSPFDYDNNQIFRYNSATYEQLCHRITANTITYAHVDKVNDDGKDLAIALANNSSLTHLDLFFPSPICVTEIIGAIINNCNIPLRSLNFHYGTVHAAADIGCLLATNTSLEQLGLLEDIKIEEIEKLGGGLAKNSTLHILKIENDAIDDRGSIAIAWALENSKSLHTFELTSDRITNEGATEIFQSLSKNTSLTTVKLGGTNIMAIPQVSSPICLQTLNLTGCQIATIPDNLSNSLLINLTSLDLSENMLQYLPPSISQLQRLKYLVLDTNRLSKLPMELCLLGNLEALFVSDNPLVDPPLDIVQQGTVAILSHLKRLYNGCTPQHRARLMILGDSNAGKTSLRRYIKDYNPGQFGVIPILEKPPNFPQEATVKKKPAPGNYFPVKPLPQERTVAIEVDSISLGSYQIDCWDFAGQEDYLYYHQVFLSLNCLYLLVVSMKELEQRSMAYMEGRMKFWLRSIQSRVGAAGVRAKVIIVGTHRDLCTNVTAQNFATLVNDINEYINNPQTSGFVMPEILFYTTVGLQENTKARTLVERNKWASPVIQLRAEIQKYIKENCLLRMPDAFLDFESQMKKLQDQLPLSEPPIIVVSEFKDRIGNLSEIDMKEALGLYHSLGSLFYHQDITRESLVILRPQWLAQLFARIVLSTKAAKYNGWLSITDFGDIVKSSSNKSLSTLARSTLPALMTILESFDVCFYNQERKAYYFPSLQGIQEYDFSFHGNNNPQFWQILLSIKMPFLPAGLFSNLLILLLKKFSDSNFKMSHDKILFEKEGAWTLVECEAAWDTISVSYITATKDDRHKGITPDIVLRIFHRLVDTKWRGLKNSFQISKQCPKCVQKLIPTEFDYTCLLRGQAICPKHPTLTPQELLGPHLYSAGLPQLAGQYFHDIYQLYCPQQHRLDIIFIHGLKGKAEKTWTNQNSDLWPRDWLGPDLLTYGYSARILSVAYENPMFGETGIGSFHRGASILNKLKQAGVGTTFPVIFVVHSMGGLQVKQILLAAKEDVDYPLEKNTKGIVFYATPHLGSKLANFLNWISFGTISEAVKDLMKGPHLQKLSRQFSKSYRNLPTLSYVELCGYPLIVGKNSARDYHKHSKKKKQKKKNVHRVVPVEKTHRSICRPSSRNDITYTTTLEMGNKTTKDNNAIKIDEQLMKESKLSAEELSHMLQTFKAMADKDGFVTKEHLKEAIQKHYHSANSSTLVYSIFNLFDRDGSKTIDFREFVLALQIYPFGMLRTLSPLISTRCFDLNNDGHITRSEIREVMTMNKKLQRYIQIFHRSGSLDNVTLTPKDISEVHHEADLIFEQIDVDKSREVSKEEFVAALARDEELRKRVTSLLMAEETRNLFLS